MTRHTPGPWKATRSTPEEGADVWWITANFDLRNAETDVATVAGGKPTSEANAALIAAAPETAAERDRLRALNAELVEALANLHEMTGYALPYIMGEWLTKGTAPYDNRYEIETAMTEAAAVLEKCK